MFCECSEVSGSDAIAQGDVIEWLPREDDPWKQFGLIVTADCDLALEKHAGIISYVPILRLRDYVRLFYLPRRLGAEAERLFTALVGEMRRLQEERRPDFDIPLSEDAVRSALGGEASGVTESLRAEGQDADRLEARITAYKACLDALESPAHDGAIEAFVLAREALGTAPEKSRPALMNDIRNLVERLPGDGFFLGALSPVHRDGYVAYLRLVREANEGDIALKQSQLSGETIRARRIARLDSPYVYYLTQRLSTVFAAIGLPTEYENNRAIVARDQYRERP